MTAYDLEVVPVLANHFGGLLSYKLVAGAVESVTTDAVFLVIFVGQAVEIRLRRQSAVKCRVKHDRLRHTGQYLAHSVDTSQIAGGVERSQMLEALDLLYHLVGNDGAVLENLAAVGNTVADSADFLQVLDNANLRIGQSLEDYLDTLSVVGNRQLLIVFLTVKLVGELAHF